MGYEEKFHVLLLRAGFLNVQTKKRILPSFASGRENLETDHVAHKRATLYIFEGKRFYLLDAKAQLKLRYESAILNREKLIEENYLWPYNNVRIFLYSILRGIIAEYNKNGQKLWSKRFRNLNELTTMLKEL